MLIDLHRFDVQLVWKWIDLLINITSDKLNIKILNAMFLFAV